MKSITTVSPRTRAKILKRLKLSCFKCGWGEASCDIHHITPKSKGGSEEHSNLTILCPNCHRIAHEHPDKLGAVDSIEARIGDKWLEAYHTEGTKAPSIRKQISEGMKKAHQEGRSSVFGKKYESSGVSIMDNAILKR